MKIKQKFLFQIIIGILLSSGLVYAASFYANDIRYEPIDTNWEVSNVEDALNDLYNKAKTKEINYENVLDNFAITPSNSNASGSNISPVNLGKDDFYNLTGTVNYQQNVSFGLNKDLTDYKFIKIYIEYWTTNSENYTHNVDLTIGDEILSFKLIPIGQNIKTKTLVVGINNPENKTITMKLEATANVPNSMNFNIGFSLGK